MIRKLLLLILAINIAYVVTGVARYGSQHVDAYGIWMLKAKAWVAEGGVPLELLRDPDYLYSHQQYPLLLPAMMAGWVEIFGSVESFVWVYPVVYGLVLVVLYRLTGNLTWAVVASFMGPLMAQGGRGHAGLADIWITLLVGLAMLSVRSQSFWRLAMIVMVASQIKAEGIFLLALFWGIKGNIGNKIGWMLLATMPFLWWQWQVREWALLSDLGFYWPGLPELFNRLIMIVGLVIREMLNWRNWYIVWPLWWITLAIRTQNSKVKGQSIELKVFGMMSLGYVGVYLFSTLEPAAYVGSSIDRVLLQLLPLWWVVVGGRLNLTQPEYPARHNS
jgi:hypothetical protein